MPAEDFAVARSQGRRPANRRGYLPALDGLRGIGIAAVVAFHLNASWLPGGYLGVDIFFVVSGFLITRLLLGLFEKGTRSSLAQFWARRARRLLPGLVVLLVGVALAAALFAHDAIPELRADIPAALGFVANWRLLLHHDNYFQAIGRPPLLQHLWSLGVEEQSYLIWPFVVLLVVRKARRPLSALCWTAALGAVGSALLMALLFVPSHASGVYYDTFTHASGLLIGATLAGATRGRRADLSALARKRRARVGAVAFAGLGLLLVFLGSNGSFAYRGGIFLASALTGMVLLVSLQPGPAQRLLSVRPLRYLGTRSYSLYLWHWPVICLTRPDIDVRLSGAPLLVLRLVLIGASAEASYHFIEQPFRTGRAQAALRSLRRPGRTVALGGMGACGASAVVLLAVINPAPLSAAMLQGSTPAARADLEATTTTTVTAPPPTRPVWFPPPSTSETTQRSTPATSTTAPSTPATSTTAPSTPATSTTAPSTPATSTTAPITTAPTRTTSTSARPATPKVHPQANKGLGHQVLAIGDSVLLAASTALEERLHGNVTVDATVSRQVWSGLTRLSQYRDAGDFRGLKAIVIDLGTNGPMYPWDVTRFRQLSAGVPLLVFVNVRVPRAWQSTTNASVAAVAGQPGVRVVNWFKASSVPGVLWVDGVHPDPKGQAIFANLVAKAPRAVGYCRRLGPLNGPVALGHTTYMAPPTISNMTAMATVPRFLGLTGRGEQCPIGLGPGGASSVVFVALIAIPAAALNARDHKRRQGGAPLKPLKRLGRLRNRRKGSSEALCGLEPVCAPVPHREPQSGTPTDDQQQPVADGTVHEGPGSGPRHGHVEAGEHLDQAALHRPSPPGVIGSSTSSCAAA